MDEAIELLHRVIDAEYRALIASYVEPDDEAYLRLHRAAEAMFDNRPGNVMVLGFGRAPGQSPEQIAAHAGGASQFALRPLFVVRKRATATHGEIFEAIVGSSRPSPRPQYDERWLVTMRDAPKVFARHARIRARDALRWEHVSGADPSDLGPILDVRRFVAPAKPEQLADWHSP